MLKVRVARRTPEQTASPQRNFTLSTEERLQAMVIGPPAWARRRKRIEDLSAQIPELHREGKSADVKRRLEELVKLVESHNRYYPVEANLPLDPETSQMMELGRPWKPLPRPTLESLLAAEARAERGPASLAWTDAADALSVAFDASDGARVTLRLDGDALTCKKRKREVARVPTSHIEEITAARALEVVTREAETIRFPFELDDEDALARVARELGARLRTLRAALGGYRGEPVED
jgi:hypothetical protein